MMHCSVTVYWSSFCSLLSLLPSPYMRSLNALPWSVLLEIIKGRVSLCSLCFSQSTNTMNRPFIPQTPKLKQTLRNWQALLWSLLQLVGTTCDRKSQHTAKPAPQNKCFLIFVALVIFGVFTCVLLFCIAWRFIFCKVSHETQTTKNLGQLL